MVQVVLRRCKNCSKGVSTNAGTVMCGAGFEENPVWAVRQRAGMFNLIVNGLELDMHTNTDCDNMDLEDGDGRKAFWLKEELRNHRYDGN